MRWIALLFLLWPHILFAGERGDFSYSDFARIPILHEGRIKPLDSFARISLRKIYGAKSLPKESAIQWLASAMFNPGEAVQKNIFLVRSNEVARILTLPERSDQLYSFVEIAAVMGEQKDLMKSLVIKDKKQLTAEEQEMLRLYMNINDFAEITGAFTLLLPMHDHQDANYMDLLKDRYAIDTALRKTVKEKGDRIEQYSPEEQKNARISYRLSVLDALYSRTTLVRVIPPSWEGMEEWLSPWAVIVKGEGSPASRKLFEDWQAFAKAYNGNDAATWNALSQKLRDKGDNPASVRPFALSLEVIYNAFDPLRISLVGYIIGTFLAAITLLITSRLSYQKPVLPNTESTGRRTVLSGLQSWINYWMPAFAGMTAGELLYNAAYVIIFVNAAIHGMGILMRMMILLRPPVSTLYESMIFVSFVSACFGLWLEHKKKGGESLLISGVIASLLIAAANVFAADSDTLEVLVAVLNTNFWLGTHVVCITTGYASSLIAGAIAHMYLIRQAFGKMTVSERASLQRRLHNVALVALLFTAIGTMLGGIWADQSWGRFWGWDPKENGALWIVLWLIWMLHARISGQLHEIGFASGMAFITVVVALAWVGVNLLSVGLHSYGFTDVAAHGLMIFCGVEVVFISGSTALALYRQQQ